MGDLASIPELRRSFGEGNGYPLQYFGLENFMDCTVHGVGKSWTRLSDYLPQNIKEKPGDWKSCSVNHKGVVHVHGAPSRLHTPNPFSNQEWVVLFSCLRPAGRGFEKISESMTCVIHSFRDMVDWRVTRPCETSRALRGYLKWLWRQRRWQDHCACVDNGTKDAEVFHGDHNAPRPLFPASGARLGREEL